MSAVTMQVIYVAPDASDYEVEQMVTVAGFDLSRPILQALEILPEDDDEDDEPGYFLMQEPTKQ